MGKIGLITGKGKLPVLWCREAKKRGYEIVSFSVVNNKENLPASLVDKSFQVNIGNLGRLLELLQEHDINEVIMLGKVEKKQLFDNFKPDFRMKQLLQELENFNDENILLSLARELQSQGIKIRKQSTFLEHLLSEPGPLTPAAPDRELMQDMKYGFKQARAVGKLDIGQTVIVKNQAVLAVEAVEGTDAAIKRGGKLGGTGIVMAKVSRPGQDLRFDIPTVGLDTLKYLIQAQAWGLVIEAGKTFLLDKEKLLNQAQKNGISIYAMKAEENSHG